MTRQTTIQTDEGAPRRSLQIEERTDAQVEALIAWGYAQNLTEVVRHAIREAWERQITYQEAQEMAEGFDFSQVGFSDFAEWVEQTFPQYIEVACVRCDGVELIEVTSADGEKKLFFYDGIRAHKYNPVPVDDSDDDPDIEDIDTDILFVKTHIQDVPGVVAGLNLESHQRLEGIDVDGDYAWVRVALGEAVFDLSREQEVFVNTDTRIIEHHMAME